MNIQDAVKELAETRHYYEAAKMARRQMIEELEAQTLYKNLKNVEIELDARIERLRLEIEAAAIERQEQHPAVKVENFKVVKYDTQEATNWARDNMSGVMILDTKAFEHIVKTGVVDIPVATVETEKRIKISSNLTPYL